MKKLSILMITLILFSGIMKAQDETVTWEGLIKQKEKSDKDIQDPKKSVVSKTWMNRAQTFLNIYTFEIGGLYKGMPAKGEGFQTAEFLIGKPGKIMTEGDAEVWVYNRKKLYFVNGVLDRWEQTEFIDKDALNISAQSFMKAIELDETGKLKDKATTKDLLSMIKNYVINDAIDKYLSKDYDNAYTLMGTGYDLCKLPKNDADTVFNIDQIGYYQGIIAFNANKFDKAKEHFQKSIDVNYQPGAAYHYLASSYLNMGDSAGYLDKVKEGFEKHPEEEQLIIDLINFYMTKKNTDEAVKFIDLAISKKPDNPSYYSAKATIYDNTTDGLMAEYKKAMEQAFEFKKLAFQNRNDAPKKDEYDKKRDESLKLGQKYYDEYMSNLDKAEKLYKESLEIDPKFFNAAYNLGRIDLKRNELNLLHADYVYKILKDVNPGLATEFENKAKENLTNAATKFEAAYKIDPKDKDTLEVLRRIYFRLHDKENENRVIELINKLGNTQNPGME
jgi:tetratricopeptide (TPR) repeat protein